MAKWSLKTELLQYRDAEVVKGALPDDWKNVLWEHLRLKRSSLLAGIQIYKEFRNLLLYQIDGHDGDDGWDVHCEYASIPSSSLKLLLKVAKGATDEAKEEWLREAAALSYTDLKKRIDEITGKEVCDCVEWIEKTIYVCRNCGKRKKGVEEEADESGGQGS